MRTLQRMALYAALVSFAALDSAQAFAANITTWHFAGDVSGYHTRH